MTKPPAVQPVQITAGWELLPFRFHRLTDDRVLLTNMVGEHDIVSDADLRALVSHKGLEPAVRRRLRGKHFLRLPGEGLPIDLLAMKTRTRHARLAEFTSLHLFVVTLRCEHACPYCQVSRRSSAKTEFDMSETTARQALAATFRSPARTLKIEFQGGEPLLNFELVKFIVTEAERLNEVHGKDLRFVIATNLALIDDVVLDFAAEHDIDFSTSLDGPQHLHNANRPRPGGDSWQRAVAGIDRIRERLGAGRVSALMTTTEASLAQPVEIIDSYVELGFTGIFLRPLSPYGHAIKSAAHAAYDVERWLDFYRQGLDHLIELNRRGVSMVEHYASIVLTKMLTNRDPGYVDLTSPAGIGISAIVYNYDGDVYASDEGRMLAEMGDTTFRLGNLAADSYEDILLADALLDPLEDSFAYSAPMCNDCAFECYCGADPVFHHATTGDYLGRKSESAFCRRNMTVFELLLDRYHGDEFTRRLFDQWANQ